jgi:hypothetical protein
MSFDELLERLQVPADSLLELLTEGDESFPALDDDPHQHRYSSSEVSRLEAFREALKLPMDNPFRGYSAEELERIDQRLVEEGPMQFGK